MSTRLSPFFDFVDVCSVRYVIPARIRAQAFKEVQVVAIRRVSGDQHGPPLPVLCLNGESRLQGREGETLTDSFQCLNVDENTAGWPGFEAIAPISTKHQAIEIREVTHRPFEEDSGKKRGPKMKGYPYGCMKTKKFKKRFCLNSPRTLNVIENKALNVSRSKCYRNKGSYANCELRI
jgi:hypothetical protein